MKKDDFTKAILNNRALSENFLVKRKIRTVPNITAKELFDAIYEKETVKGVASYFSVSVNTINRVMKEVFPDLKVLGGSRSWRYVLLDLVGFKMCTNCENIKSKDNFYSGHATELRSTCISCDKFLSAGRRTSILDATDTNASIEEISFIYANCPTGYHVDHIVPLSRGGKHCPKNLCYLLARDNLLKSNKLPEEVPEIMDRAKFP